MKRQINTHELKIEPEHFAGVVNGSKKAEFRINDRGFQYRDVIRLREWVGGDYTGREIYVVITDVTDVTKYISESQDSYLDKCFVMLSFNIIPGTLCNRTFC